MSLFSAIQMAAGAMRVDDIGLQVVGQNIANANTPGYLRENLVLSPSASIRVGGLEMGTGVQATAVAQEVNNFLEERLRGAMSDTANATTQQNTYKELEGVLGSLDSNSTGTLLTNFFSAIQTVLNQPADASARNQVVLQGQTLTENVNHLSSQVSAMRSDLNTQVVSMATDMNRLIDQIGSLNVQIANLNGGNTSKSDGVGLNDQRMMALQNLAKLVNVRVTETPTGGLNVYCGSTYLVSAGNTQHVEAVLDSSSGLNKASVHIAGTDAPLDVSAGQLYGLTQARDTVLGGVLDKLDNFSQSLAYEFNKVYSSGQGLTGYSAVTSEFAVDDTTQALNVAGLKYTPGNGSFQVQVRDTTTGLTKTAEIHVNLSGTGQQTTLQNLANQLNAVDGLSAQVTSDGRLQLTSQSANTQFAFANDTSGTLAALGINTFFSGSSAGDLGVSQAVQDNPSLFAASQGGIGADTKNAVALAGFADRPLDSQGGNSITTTYNNLINGVTQQSAVANSHADSATSFQSSLQSEETAVSGVNLDEEAITMMAYQRSFQASAKFVATLNDLLGILVNL